MAIDFKNLEISGLILIESDVFVDERGFFTEKYKKSEFDKIGMPNFVQDNFSSSKKGVLRGLHYQLPPYEQGKLVTVLEGAVWDVAVDLRKKSKYFGKWFGIELNEQNGLSLYIPSGFAHGFAVLSDVARVLYKCTSEYEPALGRGVIWSDPDLNIDWKISEPILSPKDLKLPNLSQAELFD